MRISFLGLFCNLFGLVYSQIPRNLADFSLAAGSYRASASVSLSHHWQIGKKQNFSVGSGGRFTSFYGANLYYVTAPGKITSGSSSPLIIFKENIQENLDSLLLSSPQVNALNLMLNLHYSVSGKVSLGFNIDLIGFSFGSSQRGNYINGNQGKNIKAEPTHFNILLISDNDRGTLNSEFYSRYGINEKWSAKLFGQFLFTEYTTSEVVQQFPTANDRFRNKSLLAGLGVIYNINK